MRIRQRNCSGSFSKNDLLAPIANSHVPANCLSATKNGGQPSLEGKSSFTNVAQQILSAEQKSQQVFDKAHINSKLRGSMFKMSAIGESIYGSKNSS